MRLVESMTFRGALRILGQHDSSTFAKISAALGGVILAGGIVAFTGSAAAPVVAIAAIWGWVDQKNEAVTLAQKLLGSLYARRKQLGTYERSELITAAHTVLVTSSLMEVIREQLGTKRFEDLELTQGDQHYLTTGQDLLDGLYKVEVPSPNAGIGFASNRTRVANFQRELMERFSSFCQKLAVWQDGALDTQEILFKAAKRYHSRYLELMAEVPEFMIWALLGEHNATQSLVREQHQQLVDALNMKSHVLSRLESLLTALAADPSRQRELSLIVQRSALSELDDPIVPRGSAELAYAREICFPSIKEIYLEPLYRITTFDTAGKVSDEHWWSSRPVFDDLDLRLTAHFCTAEATRLPLLLLGHPGAGKSLLAKILAARLPNSSYTTVHVPLRHVTADAPIYHQIQEALNRSTHGRVNWHELTEQSAGLTRVVLLDGLDELLQATAQNHAAFLHDVTEFQRREAAQGHPVAVIVTSRTIVADRVTIPDGCIVIKLEDFTADQVRQWSRVWNAVNESGINRGATAPLTTDAVKACRDLATQPLLLLMVALYTSDPTNPPIREEISPTKLYRRLMENFSQRESTKSATEAAAYVRDHIRKLSIAALAMFNRGRQHVMDFEVTDDLTSLGLITNRQSAGDLFAQFFFIHTAQTVLGAETTKRSYEFMHATFGEYLVAAEIVEMLLDVAANNTSRRGVRQLDDHQLFAVLSHHSLAGRRSILTFAAGVIAELGDSDRDAVIQVLHSLVAGYRTRAGSDDYSDYRPTAVDHLRQLAMYCANLVLLLASCESGVSVADLWPNDGEHHQWRSALALWRAGMDENEWRAIMLTLDLNQERLTLASGIRQSIPIELTYAELNMNTSLTHTLKMGYAIQNSQAYYTEDKPGNTITTEAREAIAQWLVVSIINPPRTITAPVELRRNLTVLSASSSQLRFFDHLFSMLLRIRPKQLSDEVMEILSSELIGSPDLRFNLFAAAIQRPHFLKTNQALLNPDGYSNTAAMELMQFRTERRRLGFSETQEETDHYDAVEARWRAENTTLRA